jgi:Flp pilus assembly pilin Flp
MAVSAPTQWPRSATEFLRDRGSTATEYAILVASIAVVITVGITLFGQAVSAMFSALAIDLF